MAYTTLTVIVDGALEREENYFDYALLDEAIAAEREDAEGHGYPTEVYLVHHEHEQGECECVQFLTDHKPSYSWNCQ